MVTKADLQEEALQLEVDIYDGDGDEAKELTKAQLSEAIEAKRTANADQAAADNAEKDSARASAKEADAADVQRQADADAEVASTTTVDADPGLLERMGLKAPSKADRALAKKYGYPIAIPGGKAYRTRISFHCGMGGGERPINSVVVLTDAHAANKMDYLTAI